MSQLVMRRFVSYTIIIMTKTRKAVGALVIHENKVLLVRKVMMMDGSNGPEPIEPFWDFPKGGVTGEDVNYDSAIMRELSEEIGSTELSIIKQLPDFNFDFPANVTKKIGYTSQNTTMFLVHFTGNPSTLAPQDGEIDTITFFTKQEAMKMVQFDASAEYIDDYFT